MMVRQPTGSLKVELWNAEDVEQVCACAFTLWGSLFNDAYLVSLWDP